MREKGSETQEGERLRRKQTPREGETDNQSERDRGRDPEKRWGKGAGQRP